MSDSLAETMDLSKEISDSGSQPSVSQRTAISEAVEPLPLQSSKVELRELLSQPELLKQASYLLLSLKDLSPQQVREKLRNFFSTQKISTQDIAAVEAIKKEHEEKYSAWKNAELQEQHERFKKNGELDKKAENINDIYCVHSTNYTPLVENNQAVISTTFQGSEAELLRSSVHFSLNHPVEAVGAEGVVAHGRQAI